MAINLPAGYGLVQHFFYGGQLPRGAAISYGVDLAAVVPSAPVEALHASFGSNIMPFLNNSTTLSTTRLKEGPNETGPFSEFTNDVEGGATGEPEPPSICYLVEKRTAMGGRRGQGRLYLPGVETSRVDSGGLLITTLPDDLRVALTEWLDELEGLGMRMVLLHSGAVSPSVVTSLTLDPRVATQRRRLR